MKNFLRREWPLLLLLIVPFLIIPFVWVHIPSQMAVHFDLKGNVNGTMPRAEGLLIVPLLNIVLYGVLAAFPGIDPKKKISAGQKPVLGIRFYTILFLLFIYILLILFNMGVKENMDKFLKLAVLVLFIILGNYMNSLKSNYFIGIRTPWTLEDPEVWRKTHRMAGKLWVILPIILIPILFISSGNFFTYCFFSVIALLVLIPVVYSYVIYQKKSA